MRAYILLPLLALAAACGSTTSTVSSSVDMAGSYSALGTLSSNTCGGDPNTVINGTLTITGSDKNYTVQTAAGNFSAEQTGNTLTWTNSLPESTTDCSGTLYSQVQVNFSESGGSGNETSTLKLTCNDGSSADCVIVYAVTYTKQ